MPSTVLGAGGEGRGKKTAQSLVSVAPPLAEETDTGRDHSPAANVIKEVPSRRHRVPEGEPETLGSWEDVTDQVVSRVGFVGVGISQTEKGTG